MKRQLVFWPVVALGFGGIASGTTPRPMTPEDVIALERVSDPQVSPDGANVAFVLTTVDDEAHAYQSDLWLVGTDAGDALRLTYDPKHDRAPSWSPDSQRIAFLSTRADTSQIFVLDVRGGEARQISDAADGVSAFTWSPDGQTLAYLATDPRPEDQVLRIEAKDDERVVDHDFRMTHLWTVPLDGGEPTRLTEGALTLSDPQWSPAGEWIAVVKRPNPTADDRRLADIVLVPSAGGEIRALYENAGPDTSPRWSPDGSRIAFVTRDAALHPHGNGALRVIDVDPGSSRALTDLSLQPRSPVWSADGTAIRFVAGRGVQGIVWSVPAAGGAVEAIVEGPFVAGSYTEAGDGTVAYLRESLQRPAGVWVRRPGAKAEARTAFNTWVADLALAEAETVRWSSRDGLEVEGLLFRPPGVTRDARLPLLVEVHGGPAGAQTLGFPGSWGRYSHVYAGRGWAVFQPNFRGSSGYGDEFLRLDIKDWQGDYDDIMSGIDRLVADGVADPARLAMRGWSYGGYMTAWAVTQTDQFRAASAGAGLTNLVSMYGTNDIPSTLVDYFGGAPWDDLEEYRRASAMTFITQASTPTLILHGEEDDRVPLGQSQEFYLGLKQNGVPVQMVVYPREPHGLREPNHQLDKMQRELRWFDQHVLGRSTETEEQP